ncbi:MAG TPA: DUF4180 domain-containing protein [Steroidobacteraceae bacterium]|jgi:hypothetical protein|nr:DUF4180 domain-containing protein [Steroidobacteraceae bacterium]
MNHHDPAGLRKILVAADAGISIGSMSDVSKAVGATWGTAGLILTEADLSSEFFDLKSGLAGELFQKFANYALCLAIIVPRPERYGERFNELAREHASHNKIRIVRCKEDAVAWLHRG